MLQQLEPQGFVSDFAGVIPDTDKQQIVQLLTELEQKTGAEVAVVSIRSMKGGQIDDFANRLFERWGVGKKGRDNGVLILAAIDDRKGRIEVGYGLEGILPDALAGRILRQDLFAPFKKGNYGKGFTQGAQAVAGIIAGDKGVQLTGVPRRMYTQRRTANKSRGRIFKFLFMIVVLYLIIRHPFLALILLSGGRGGYRSGSFSSGGFGGGFGGFGGGMSGGGGASGGW